MSAALVLAHFLCSYSSNAELLEEGTTITQEIISSDGEITEIKETTTTVEHESETFLDNANVDVGGIGSIYSHSSCNSSSGFPDDGRTPNCGRARNNSLTTWQRNIDLSSFGIEDGGQIDWELYFAFPNSMYQNEQLTAYTEMKGYVNNQLVFETGQEEIDKSLFEQNKFKPSTNWSNLISGSYNFDGQLTKLFVVVGGRGSYYWDEYEHIITWNNINTTVNTYIDIIQPTIVANELESLGSLDLLQPIQTVNPSIEIEDTILSFDVVTDMDFEINTMETMEELPVAEVFEEVFAEVFTEEIQEIENIDLDSVEMTEIAEIEGVEEEVSPINDDTEQNLTSTIDNPTEETEVNETLTEADIEITAEEEKETATENSSDVAEVKETAKNDSTKEEQTLAEKKTEKSQSNNGNF